MSIDDSLAHLVPPERWADRVRELRAENDHLRHAMQDADKVADDPITARAILRGALGIYKADRPEHEGVPAGETHKVQGRTP